MLLNIIALILVLISAGLIFLFSLPRFRNYRVFRSFSAFEGLRRAIGLAVENGSRIHVSLGKGSLTQNTGASGLSGLVTLGRIAQISSISDRPPIATSGDGTLAILSQDTLKAAYRATNNLELYDPDRGLLAGPTPLSYVAGTLPIAAAENISTHILTGNFGPEIALLVEGAEKNSAFTLGASNSLSAQAALYASAQEPLIGEELFAIPAYLNAGPAHSASLMVQDVLRWGVIAVLVIGSILKFLGIL